MHTYMVTCDWYIGNSVYEGRASLKQPSDSSTRIYIYIYIYILTLTPNPSPATEGHHGLFTWQKPHPVTRTIPGMFLDSTIFFFQEMMHSVTAHVSINNTASPLSQPRLPSPSPSKPRLPSLHLFNTSVL